MQHSTLQMCSFGWKTCLPLSLAMYNLQSLYPWSRPHHRIQILHEKESIHAMIVWAIWPSGIALTTDLRYRGIEYKGCHSRTPNCWELEFQVADWGQIQYHWHVCSVWQWLVCRCCDLLKYSRIFPILHQRCSCREATWVKLLCISMEWVVRIPFHWCAVKLLKTFYTFCNTAKKL